MGLKFGTSGVRGLVTEMTDLECYLYCKAYAQYLKRTGATTVCIAGDFRSSSPRILKAVAFGIQEAGLTVDYVGFAPTPTLALHSMSIQAGAVMVTGSHIPDDRNGIKFYMPAGEILKSDEQAISATYAELKAGASPDAFDDNGMLKAEVELGAVNESARERYIQRYTGFFPADCLSGLRIVCYQHSTVGRTLIPEILETLGAAVQLVGWSDQFVPVDTEAIANPDELAAWVKQYEADALVSADGDCDRPLLVDEQGQVIRGDVLGILAASFLKADSISTPVSCNSAVELCGRFKQVFRTQIGSPYVIAAMNESVSAGHVGVIGYEANGGFLTATDLAIPGCSGTLTALPTRDAVLPILAALLAARAVRKPLSALKNELPPRYTAGGIIREFPTEIGQKIVKALSADGPETVNELLAGAFGPCEAVDLTDGCRMTFADGGVLHLRPSGNAPEFRIYTEYSTEAEAVRNNELGRRLIEGVLKPKFG
jgi:phosphomannomutase